MPISRHFVPPSTALDRSKRGLTVAPLSRGQTDCGRKVLMKFSRRRCSPVGGGLVVFVQTQVLSLKREPATESIPLQRETRWPKNPNR
jgi:hypothetical protein